MCLLLNGVQDLLTKYMEKAQRNTQTEFYLMKFSRGKRKVLLLERNNPMPFRLGTNLLENSFAEKELGVLVEQLN